MLIKGFYQVNEIRKTNENEYEAFIRINKDHDIFKGHFPGNPIAPGVCMLQILKEITSEIVDKKLVMESSNNIKFMALINPEETPDLKLTIVLTSEDNYINVRSICYFGDTVALKMGVKYKII